jgi:hypothetical protein
MRAHLSVFSGVEFYSRVLDPKLLSVYIWSSGLGVLEDLLYACSVFML